MQKLDPQLEIASRVLGGLVGQNNSRKLADRHDDIVHALELAAELLRQGGHHGQPMDELTLRPRAEVKTRERIIQREDVPLDELIDKRRSTGPTRSSRGPTLH